MFYAIAACWIILAMGIPGQTLPFTAQSVAAGASHRSQQTSQKAETVILSIAQIEQLWVANGGPPSAAPLMAAITTPESGGNTLALNNNPITEDYSVGLWQINYFGDLYAGRSARYGTPDQLLADPNLQAKAAIDLYGGGAGLSNWAADSYLWAPGAPPPPDPAGVASGAAAPTGAATGGLPGPTTDISVGGIAGTIDPAFGIVEGILGGGGIISSAEKAVRLFGLLLEPSTWYRITEVVGGGLIIGVGVVGTIAILWGKPIAAVAALTPGVGGAVGKVASAAYGTRGSPLARGAREVGRQQSAKRTAATRSASAAKKSAEDRAKAQRAKEREAKRAQSDDVDRQYAEHRSRKDAERMDRVRRAGANKSYAPSRGPSKRPRTPAERERDQELF